MRRRRWLARFRRKRRNRLLYGDGVLNAAAFEQAAMGERMRVDRNGSVLAMIAVALPDASAGNDAIGYLARVLVDRLRMTDTVGVLRDGRLGVLLPDTPAAGAWKVADDIRDLLVGGGVTPTCEVLLYPEDQPSESWSSGGSQEDSVDSVNINPMSGPGGMTAAVATKPVSRVASPVVNSEPRPAIQPTAFEQLLARPLPWWKRATDLAVSSVGLAVAVPIIGVAAVAVAATSPGGAFFVQVREGLGGRRFKIYKLRTMRADAEEQKAGLRQFSEQDGPAFKMTTDPRVTRLGQLLRKLSIDELPQLINVLKGEMSLVGPRPLPVEESQRCEPWQRQRLMVTPGITCTWQVHARNAVPFDEWVRMDLRYQQRHTLWHDIKLLLQTGPSLMKLRGPR